MSVGNLELQHLVSIGLLLCLLPANNRAGGPAQEREPVRLFNAMIIATLGALACEALSLYSEGRPGLSYRIANIGGAAATFILCPLPGIYYCLYTRDQFAPARRSRRAFSRLFAAIAAVNLALTLASLRFGWYFSVSPRNGFSVGPLWPLSAVLSYLPLLLALGSVLVYRSELDGRTSGVLLLTSLMMAVAIVVQVALGPILILPVTALSILVLFLYINLNLIEIDHLTGLKNRFSLGVFERRLEREKAAPPYACVSFDLNGFKDINDSHGHAAGDAALIDFSAVLRKAFRRSDFIARVGGDEFIVIMRLKADGDERIAVERFRAELERRNARGDRPWVLSAAVGTSLLGPSGIVDALGDADRLMYEDKGGGHRPASA